jgi:hypothetical protein
MISRAIVAMLLLVAPAVHSQQPPPPKGQMPSLGRPTESTDEVPLFNFDAYFPGKWTFEWNVPEGVLGPAGPIDGTTTYKATGGRFYEAETQATGPAGPITIKERIAYHRENKIVSKYVTDSRGFSYLSMATVAGDLGGIYNILFESEPFVFKGRTLRLRESIRVISPLNYRVSASLSVDGGPFASFGTPWWQKDAK